ncbi:glycosyltransferase family 9 protein, partial [Enterococcus faecium]|uniref:glycosyltransferase family 9 protein n=1 Tax=Enterococcus faecium TaxID=1352 RepID=UPI0034E97DDA
LKRKENQTYIALVPRSAGRPSTNWSEAKWVELVRKFPQYNFVVLDGSTQPLLEVHDNYAGPRLYLEPNVIDMTGKTSTIKHAMAILRHCDACVGVDTGITQMSNAAQIPMILLIGATAGWARAPLQGKNRILQGAAPC